MTHWNDIYHGNAPYKMTGAICAKVGEGRTFTDPMASKFFAQASAEGHHAFAYYALHHGSKSEMVEQAKRAAGLIGRRPAMFDCERWPAQSGSAPGMVTLEGITEAVDEYRAAGGIMNVIYLPRSMWQYMGSPDLYPLVARGLHNINANYNSGSETPGHLAWDSYGGMGVWAVQYRPCHNVCNSTWAQALSVWDRGSSPAHPAQATKVYTVAKGDSLISIAQDHNMGLPLIEQLNPHAGHPSGNFDLIQPGDRITVLA